MRWPNVDDAVWDDDVYPPELKSIGDVAAADLLMDRLLLAFKNEPDIYGSSGIFGSRVLKLDLLPPVGSYGAMPKLVIVSGVIGITEAPSQLDAETTRIYAQLLWTQKGVNEMPLGRGGIPSVLQKIKQVVRQAQEMTVVWSGMEQQLAHLALVQTHDTLFAYEQPQGGPVFGQAVSVDYEVELTRSTSPVPVAIAG